MGVGDVHVERRQTLIGILGYRILERSAESVDEENSENHLSKVAHLAGIVWEASKHVHARKSHPQHVVSTKSSVGVAILLLLLLLLLLVERGAIGTHLRRHSITVGLCVDT